MSEGSETLKTLKFLRNFILENTTDGLNRRVVIGGFDVLEKELKAYERTKSAERKLGIDLATLLKASTNGFWFKGQYGGLFEGSGVLDFHKKAIVMDEDDGYYSLFPFSEYGKTWALTKGELLKTTKIKTTDATKTNTITFEDGTEVTFLELPDGYFYKGRFLTETQCFGALRNDGEATAHKFLNGTWKVRDILFPSLEELYEYVAEEVSMPFSAFRRRYQSFGVSHDPRPCVLYSYARDDDGVLYDSKVEALMRIKDETDLIETTEAREERYLNGVTKKECIEYFRKPKKERIKILEEFK